MLQERFEDQSVTLRITKDLGAELQVRSASFDIAAEPMRDVPIGASHQRRDYACRWVFHLNVTRSFFFSHFFL